jgi:hypothetical protein
VLQEGQGGTHDTNESREVRRRRRGNCELRCNRIGGEPTKFERRLQTVYGDDNLVSPHTLSVTGCVTASGDRFVRPRSGRIRKPTSTATGARVPPQKGLIVASGSR